VPRDTGTGADYKSIVHRCLVQISHREKFDVERGVSLGTKPNGLTNRIDFVLTRRGTDSIKLIFSCKSQSVSGSAEEKIPYEIIRLLHTMKEDTTIQHAYLVLGGVGWNPTLLSFYVEELVDFIPDMKDHISILTTDEVMSLKLAI
jgi:hypothetical protein